MTKKTQSKSVKVIDINDRIRWDSESYISRWWFSKNQCPRRGIKSERTKNDTARRSDYGQAIYQPRDMS